MSIPSNDEREEQALDALIVAAFRQDPDEDYALLDINAPEPLLSEEDNRALDALGSDLAVRIVAGWRPSSKDKGDDTAVDEPELLVAGAMHRGGDEIEWWTRDLEPAGPGALPHASLARKPHPEGISKCGISIRTLEDWRKYAGPKSDKHWRNDRSAVEAARAWLSVTPPELPAEVSAALSRHPAFGPVRAWVAEPEAKLPFDSFRGEPRNTDLLVRARDDKGSYLIAIEAKADETFGVMVADALADAVERKLVNPRSNGVARVEQLTAALLGPRQDGEAPLSKLRYQLLTATAGALRAGLDHGVVRVVMLVQEFITRLTSAARHEVNARDLGLFVQRLSHGAVNQVVQGQLYGPFRVPGGPLLDVVPELYIGKISCDLRGREPNS
jgi:hypothetical protein